MRPPGPAMRLPIGRPGEDWRIKSDPWSSCGGGPDRCLPRRDWSFSLAPAEFIGTYLERADGEAMELHLVERDLALHMGRSIRFNSAQLNRLAGVFRCGAVLLLIEVLAWVVALAAVG
jgi:hypothetical protein